MTNSIPSRGRPPRTALFGRFTAAIEGLSNYGGLPKPHDARGLWDGLWFLEAHHSTAIEGNTLVLREVERLLREGRAVGSKELREYLEVLGYGVAARWVYDQALAEGGWRPDDLISLTEVREVHRLTMQHVWAVSPHTDATTNEGPGSFREHEIHRFGGGLQPPTFPLVHSELSAWVDEVCTFGRRVRAGTQQFDGVPEELARLHRTFEWIHPFIDGNGRTGRLLLNLILVRLGWPPAIIFKDQRTKYLRALGRADHGDVGPLAELLSRSVIDNLHRLIPNIAGPARFVPLQALADDEFSYVALKQAVSRGRLEAIRGRDGQWRSSRAAVEVYKESRYRR